jgi:hypothetical protein
MLSQEESKIRATRIRLEIFQRTGNRADNRKITCEDCLDNDNCEFAFDHYNTDGDCLAIK